MNKLYLTTLLLLSILFFANTLAFSHAESNKNGFGILNLSEILIKGGFSFDQYSIKTKTYNGSLSFILKNPTNSFFSRYAMKDNLKNGFIILTDTEGNKKEYYLNASSQLNQSQEDLKSYIVKFKDPPLTVKEEELKGETEKKINEMRRALTRTGKPVNIGNASKSLEIEMKKNLKDYENGIKLTHDSFKEKVKNISNSIEKNQFKEYKNVFNGISLQLPASSLNEIKNLPYVAEVYEDKKVEAFLNDSTAQINATNVWNLLDDGGRNVTGFNVTIAIVDSGIDYTHPDLGNCTESQFLNHQCSKVIGGYDFVNEDDDPMDDYGHGTHCAGIAAGNGTLKGVAPGAKLLAYKVIDSYGWGYESDVIAGIERAVNDSADIISMSLGSSGGSPDDPVSQAVDNAVNSSVVVVVAAGNDGPEYGTIDSPANAVGAIAVGAVDKTGSIPDFSSRGPVLWKNTALLKPDLVAPGVDICSAEFDSVFPEDRCIDDSHILISGTSMAAPHVAGVAALLKQYHKDWTVDDIRSALITTSTDLGYDAVTQGAGLVNALKASNVSILVDPCQINSSFFGNVTPIAQIPVRIRNQRPYQISVNLTVENATSEDGGNYNISYLNATNILINANSESTVLFTLNMTDQGGIFFGKIMMKAEGSNYTVPYIASWLAELNVSVLKTGTILFPDIIIHDEELKSVSEANQLFDFIGPNYTFSLSPNKNITVYALGDYLNESLTYILMKKVYVPAEGANIILNLSDSRPFTINGTSLSGSTIMFDYFEFGFATYRNDAIPIKVYYYYLIPKTGNQIIYLSNKPDSRYDTDIILDYDGIPVSGYVDYNNIYYTSKEQYAMGWVLHDINDTTSTSVTYSSSDLATYNYSYDFPADEPYIYYDFCALFSPVPNNMSEYKIIFGNQLAVPLNRTYYVKGINPAPENYKTNWSFFNIMKIDYLEFLDPYGFAHFEQYTPVTSAYRSINPVPEENNSFSFGKAPYTPTSFLVNNSSIRISDYLMKGYIPKIYLWRDTSDFGSLELMPRYQIFLNGSSTPVSSGNLTDANGIWNHTLFNYNFTSNGTYLMNLTIPSNYPVWNITRLETVFYIPGSDVQPPVLNHIEAKPYFETNKPYSISMNITDNIGVKNVSAEYWENSTWLPLTVQNNSGVYETNLTISSSATSFDFKVSINDTSNNQMNYTISPLALIGKNTQITLKFDSINASQGGLLPVSGTVKKNGVGITRLKVDFLLNNTSVGSAINDFGYYSGYAKLPCNSPSTPNITAKFYGTGVFIGNETLNSTSINIVPLNFTVNESAKINYVSLINANCYGAYLTINKSEFSYSDYMSGKTFYFTPHHYGNYTVTMNTSCGENISRNVFANITSPPSINYVYSYPLYPIVGDDLYISVSTYSQDQHNLAGNLSNSSMNSALNFSFLTPFSIFPLTDTYTNEIYNSSYCTDCWSTTVNDMQLGIYNISLELTDAANQKNRTDTTIYSSPPVNLSFNITDTSGKPVNRSLIIGFDTYYKVYEYQISGYQELMLPNITYFNKPFHVSIENYTGITDYQLVRFENSTVQSSMNATSDYLESRSEFPDKILYSVYSYQPSWNFSRVYVKFAYFNASRFNMHNMSKASIYSCKSYDFSQKACTGSWVNITTSYDSYGPYIFTEGQADDPQAAALGEPQTCGDGYCSPYESCSSCPADCGTCTTTTTPSGLGGSAGYSGSSGIITTTTKTTATTTLPNINTEESNNATSTNEPCPFECCVEEANYTDKTCSSGSDCINHSCIPKKEKGIFDEINWFLVGGGIAIVFVIILVYIIITLNKKQTRVTPEEAKREERKEVPGEKEKNLEITIMNLSDSIQKLKVMGYDTKI